MKRSIFKPGTISWLLLAAALTTATATAQNLVLDQGKVVKHPASDSAKAPKAQFAAGASALPAADYDSQWVKDDSTTSHAKRFAHSLGTTPRLVMVLFSPGGDSSEVYPVQWSWWYANSGNPVTIQWTTQEVVLNIVAAGDPLHGVWDASSQTWNEYYYGYWRVLAWK